MQRRGFIYRYLAIPVSALAGTTGCLQLASEEDNGEPQPTIRYDEITFPEPSIEERYEDVDGYVASVHNEGVTGNVTVILFWEDDAGVPSDEVTRTEQEITAETTEDIVFEETMPDEYSDFAFEAVSTEMVVPVVNNGGSGEITVTAENLDEDTVITETSTTIDEETTVTIDIPAEDAIEEVSVSVS